MNAIETCNDTLARFGASNFPEQAQALILAATARQRHESRVQATVEAAKATYDPGWCLLLDIHGKGGPHGAGGGTSQRSTPFSGLGTGRWNARDGGAYRVAALQALRRMLGTNHIVVEAQPEEGEDASILALLSGKPEEVLSRGGLEVHYLSEDTDYERLKEVDMINNVLALLRHGLLVTSGVWPDDGEVKFRGNPETWALLLQRWTEVLSSEVPSSEEVQCA